LGIPGRDAGGIEGARQSGFADAAATHDEDVGGRAGKRLWDF
jgi:hypothetical protein